MWRQLRLAREELADARGAKVLLWLSLSRLNEAFRILRDVLAPDVRGEQFASLLSFCPIRFLVCDPALRILKRRVLLRLLLRVLHLLV